ncbi:MFS transporter [Candidatus Lokiarchaeum ossiferum]|uniref:MFS transporter n=1 Tax=Candidatus Lokiarchaeum ossiferum TaxID=2951803 RepID=UPI00352CC405
MSSGELPQKLFSASKRKTIFGFLIFVNILRSMGGSSLTIGLPDFILELAGTLALYGVTIGIFQFVQTFFQIPNASLSDRFGRKKLIAFGMFIYIVGLFLSGFAQTITQLIIFRAVQGAGAFSSVIFATVTDLYDETERTQAVSLYSVSLTIGYILGNIAGGIITDLIGVRDLFFWAAGINLIAFILLIVILPETNPKKHRIQIAEEKKKIDRNQTREMWSLPFIFGLFMHGLRQFVFSGFLTYQIWNYRNYYSITGIQTSLILIPLTLCYIVGLMLAPRIEKKWDYFKLMIFSSAILAFTLIFTAYYHSFWIYFVVNIVFAVFIAIQDPINTTFIANLIPNDIRGFGSGIIQSVGFMMAALGQMAISALGDWIGFKFTHLSIGIIWMVVVIIIFFIERKFDSNNY